MSQKTQQSRPSAEDVARRLIVLKFVVVNALISPPREVLRKLFANWSTADQQQFTADSEVKRKEFWERLRNYGLLEHLSPLEREYAAATMVTMTPQQQTDATWRIESAQVLMWALELLPDLPAFDVRADHELAKQIPSKDALSFISSSRLRETSEIDRARNDAELWHWRSRSRQLIEDGHELPSNDKMQKAGLHTYDDIVRFTAKKLDEEGRVRAIDEDFPAKSKAYRELSDDEWSEVRSITMERHFTLNWLCGFAPNNEWDMTPTDT